jgi:hypothetical protein
LQAANFDYEKTFEAVSSFIEWEIQLPPLDVISQRVLNVLQSGAIYVHGRDK